MLEEFGIQHIAEIIKPLSRGIKILKILRKIGFSTLKKKHKVLFITKHYTFILQTVHVNSVSLCLTCIFYLFSQFMTMFYMHIWFSFLLVHACKFQFINQIKTED